MYTNYNIWLIIASFILLLAMVGSACDIIKKKAHLTEEGLIALKAIKSGMNTGRKD